MRPHAQPMILRPVYQYIFWACSLLGAIGLAAGFITAPLDTWLWLLVSFLIFSGIAGGMIAWAAIFRIAQARWTPVIMRICQSALAFVPFLIAALIVLIVGAKAYMPWVTNPLRDRAVWFNYPFFATRQIVLQGVFWLLAFWMLKMGLNADQVVVRGEQITEMLHKRLNAIAAGVAWMYVIASSLLAYDFIMSFSPEWTSTMFAPYFWCTNLFAAIGIVIMIAASLRHEQTLQNYLKPQQFQDMGTLMLALSLFDMGLFYAQYLTIWYENLPDETFFLLERYVHKPWSYLGWTSFIAGYEIAFFLLQSRFIKQHPRILVPVVVVSVLGVMLERYVLVVPSLRPDSTFLFPAGALALLGFLGIFGLSISWFLKKYPLISSADAALADIYRTESRT